MFDFTLVQIRFGRLSIRDEPSNGGAANSYHSDAQTSMLISLTVGKVDAGVAVLLTEDKRLVGSQSDTPFQLAP